MKYEVAITDSDKKTCCIELKLHLIKYLTNITNSTWHVKDEGFLSYRSGGCHAEVKPRGGPLNIFLAVGDQWIVKLNEFANFLDIANEKGKGEIAKGNTINFKSGEITWELIS